MGNRNHRYRFSVDISAENRSVTGSLNMVSVHRDEGDIHFLVDCGIYYLEKTEEDDCKNKNYRDFSFNPQNIDFVLLTHVHADHCGRIPFLYKENNGFCQKVYCSPETKHLLSYALNDSAKVLAINARRDGQKQPLYGEKEVKRALEGVEAQEFGTTFEPYDGVRVTLFKNAHLIGAAIILVQISSAGNEDINLLFLGDYHCQNVFFDVPELPQWVKKLPVHVITESTYGTVNSNDTDIPVFSHNIEKWVKEGRKTIIIPSLSLGRFQHLAYMLKCMQNEQILDKNIPIRFDGSLAISYTIAFQKYLDISPNMKDFMPENYSYVTSREEVLNYPDQQIIVATSGNANYGPAPEYIAAFIENKNAAIHFTSFLTPDSLGRRLIDAEYGKTVAVHSVMRRKKAVIATTAEFSGHAKSDQLIDFLSTLNIRTLHITHGEVDVKQYFAERCEELLDVKDIAILGMGYTMRVDPYHIVKSVREKEYFDN